MAALDEPAQLVVGGRVVLVEGLQPGDLLPQLGDLRELRRVGLLLLGRLRLVGVDLRLRPAALRLHVRSDDDDTYLPIL